MLHSFARNANHCSHTNYTIHITFNTVKMFGKLLLHITR